MSWNSSLDGYARGWSSTMRPPSEGLGSSQAVPQSRRVAQERFYGWPWLGRPLGASRSSAWVLERLEQAGAFATDVLELLHERDPTRIRGRVFRPWGAVA